MMDLGKLGKYNIEMKIGEGAFAEVYRATDNLNRTVALKVLKAALLADAEAFNRFSQEAQTAGSLFHPYIATVLDMDEVDGRCFIAMRYIDGQSLDAVIKERGSLSWKQSLQIAGQVAGALDFAHGKGLVHRDVKPQNILLSESEGAVLTDFGLVKAMEGSGMTRTAAVIGTPQYIAPEVWQGQEAGPAADQYALACIFVEMLTGRALFDAPTPFAAVAKHAAPVEYSEVWSEDVPEGIEKVLDKALAKTPEDRYPGAGMLVEALSAFDGKLLTNQGKKEKAPTRSGSIHVNENQLTISLSTEVELEMVPVSAGEFLMGSEEKGEFAFSIEKPQHVVNLNEYWIGKHPVTVEQFSVFTKATGYKCLAEIDIGKSAKHPVTSVSWNDASKFCEWVSEISDRTVRLPTEAEWEKAARGTDGRLYPWGNSSPDKQFCNFGGEWGHTTPVGKFSPWGDSPYGCVDMSGNVREWTNTLYMAYPYNEDDGREKPSPREGRRVLRGGSFYNGAQIIRCASRYYDEQSKYNNNYGFRICVFSNRL